MSKLNNSKMCMPKILYLSLVLVSFCLTAACAPAREEPSAPEVKISGSWEIGASKTKGF